MKLGRAARLEEMLFHTRGSQIRGKWWGAALCTGKCDLRSARGRSLQGVGDRSPARRLLILGPFATVECMYSERALGAEAAVARRADGVERQR